MAKAIADPNGLKRCPICNKEFFVQWQTLWSYKRGKPNPKYFCTYSCVRKYDKSKEEKHVGKPRVISPENEQEAIKCATAGGDPIAYLRNCGAKNPSAAWYHIRSKIKDTDPETYEKLPHLYRKKTDAPKATLADAMEGMMDAADEFFGKCEDMGLLKEEKKTDDDLETTAVRDKNLGEFYFDHDHNCIDWRTGLGDEVSLGISGWKLMVEKLPKILRSLGVTL